MLPRPFQPGDEYPPGSYAEFGSGDLKRDMWLRPNEDLSDPYNILLYAISVDGYRYAREVLGRDLLDMTEELEARCSSDRLPGAAFVDLRLRLFFLQRAWRHVYQGPEQSGPGAREIKYLLALHAALCDAWDREWPWNRSPTVIE